MIEVLLAVVVLAIGLLAGSRMQILGLNYTQGALTRTHATMAAYDIIDRMRLNSTGVLSSDYDGADTDNLPAAPTCAVEGCTSSQLAAADILMWGSYFGKGNANNASSIGASTLLPPGAKGSITGPDANGVTTVAISWRDLIHGNEEDRIVSVDFVVD